ncbi:uncharacterized protein [Dendrobates tinctorius]|uniref:uncharacterized protein n=1 Tax=Dendrobates tinctorius TaxID=92724 RepID=UPI003CC942DA
MPAADLGKKGARAKCKYCQKDIQGLVCRLKSHYENCNQKGNEDVDSDTTNVNEPPQLLMHQEPSTSGSNMACAARDNQYLGTTSTKQPKKKLCVQSVEKFILKTTTSQKEHFDELIAKFIFATNSSFRLVEHPLFVQMIEGIRPGYKPPSRFDISGKHLKAVYDIERAACTKYLKDKVVNMSLDGWSNIHNDPIICTCVTTEDGETYLTDTIDTSGNSHTAEYLLEIAKNSIHQCQEQFGCKVRSLVTDNASNVAKMRAELAQDDTNKELSTIDTEINNAEQQLRSILPQEEFNKIKLQVEKSNIEFQTHLQEPKPTTKVSKVAFVNTYHPFMNLFHKIIRQQWPLLYDSYPQILEFQVPPLICYKKSPNLRDLLT